MSFPEQQIDVDSLAPDDEPATPEEEFDALERDIADFPDDDALVVTDEEQPPLGKSFEFSFADRIGFVLGGESKAPNVVYGTQTLRGWIAACLHTDRGAHPACPPDFGVSNPFEIVGKQRDSGAIGGYEGRVREALLVHPRIASVDDFLVLSDPDDDESLLVTFTVGLDDGSELTTEVGLP